MQARLAERKSVPTIVVLHHPPVDTGIDWMSALGCEDWVKRLERVIKIDGPVVRVSYRFRQRSGPPIENLVRGFLDGLK